MDRADDAELELRIEKRARSLWEAEGRPSGKADDYREKARLLIGMEDNPNAATEPVPRSAAEVRNAEVEPIEAVENQGEFPTLTDQGEERTAPRRRDSRPDSGERN